MTELININSATAEELTALPGVGPAMAARIVAARPFEMIDDLRLISGVGPALLERWTPLITLAEPASPEDVILLSAESGTEPEAGEASAEAESQPETESAAPSPEEEPIPSWDGSESEPEVTEPEIPMPREKSIVPVPPKETEEEQKASNPKTVTSNQVFWLIGASSFATFILAILLTLGILSSINGGLRFGSAEQVSALTTQTEAVNLQLQTSSQEIADLRARLENLEGLSSRVSSLEKQIEELNAEIASTSKKVEAMNGQIDEIRKSTETFQTFLDGLTDLLINLGENQGAP
jgi:competence ComEA-like helix-hairpin-helix protein